jgi:putative DNA primase/helicase
MRPVVRVQTALAGYDVKPCGTGWSARCPAHEDRHASLTIGEGEDGRALLCCQRGCETADVLRSLGLSWRDLFVSPPALTDGRTFYDYRDERGTLLFQVVRIPTPDGKKFRQQQPDGCGSWIWNVKGVRSVLYRLPELLAADPAETVFIVEGEKVADDLARRGLVATTNPGGALKWRSEYSGALLGRHAAILPDHDDVGRQHGAEVVQSVDRVAASVRVVDLPGLDEHGDAFDWFAAGHTVEELRELVQATPRAASRDNPTQRKAPNPRCGEDVSKHGATYLNQDKSRSRTALPVVPPGKVGKP